MDNVLYSYLLRYFKIDFNLHIKTVVFLALIFLFKYLTDKFLGQNFLLYL